MADMEPYKPPAAVMVVTTPPFEGEHGGDEAMMTLVPIEDTQPEQEQAEAQARQQAATEDDAQLKAADWIALVEQAETQDELDAVASRYEDSGSSFKTVEDAIDKRQGELDTQ
jgi:hypothetical protein